MIQSEKEQLLHEAKTHADSVRSFAAALIPESKERVIRLQHEKSLARTPDDRAVKAYLLNTAVRATEGLESISSSPYFARCDVRLESKESRQIYIAKFSLPEQEIYSWVAPVARLRFENPGTVSYLTESNKTMHGELDRKDQFLIANGHISFMTTERLGHARELIYQEHFSNRKESFVLPEIVERMEKAQDDVIRADFRGPFLIAGPAGSGKTTLALHRIAYLLQSPEIGDKFHTKNILVLVHDTSTEQYFKELLPSLGIEGVAITTFATWAMKILGLEKQKYVVRYGETEEERDMLEFMKHSAIETGTLPEFSEKSEKSVFAYLDDLYSISHNKHALATFQKQKKEKYLDRFDLTILLQAKIAHDGALLMREKEYDDRVIGRARFKFVNTPITYSLIVLDEVQNYLPQQVKIIRSCVSRATDAITYVGDLAQQTSLCTMKQWDTAGETFGEGRAIKLEKVYRSTQEILEYISGLGYNIDIPKGLRSGRKPTEMVTLSVEDQIAHIQKHIANNPDVQIGILGLTEESLVHFKTLTKKHSNVQVLMIREAQGVEFDIAIITGVTKEHTAFLNNLNYTPTMIKEKKRVVRDLLYVGLTRAMNELHVVGSAPLDEILRSLDR